VASFSRTTPAILGPPMQPLSANGSHAVAGKQQPTGETVKHEKQPRKRAIKPFCNSIALRINRSPATVNRIVAPFQENSKINLPERNPFRAAQTKIIVVISLRRDAAAGKTLLHFVPHSETQLRTSL